MAIVSYIQSNLIFLSSGLSVAKEARLFTSINQGFNFSSMKISRPRTSKHTEFSKSSGYKDL